MVKLFLVGSTSKMILQFYIYWTLFINATLYWWLHAFIISQHLVQFQFFTIWYSECNSLKDLWHHEKKDLNYLLTTWELEEKSTLHFIWKMKKGSFLQRYTAKPFTQHKINEWVMKTKLSQVCPKYNDQMMKMRFGTLWKRSISNPGQESKWRLNNSGTITEDEEAIANTFNTFFINKIQILKEGINNHYNRTNT